MVGDGWTCANGGTTCTRSDMLSPGSSYPAITVTVNVSATAVTPQVNAVSVSGGGSATANATDSTTVILNPVLTITKTHTGNFTQAQQNATYTVTVSNGGAAGPTTSEVTVTETVPGGLTLVSMVGDGWTCALGGTTCTRSDALAGGAGYPPITVTVNVATGAASPLVNSVSVSGGGAATANATDSTDINPLPALNVTKSHTGDFMQGQKNVTYTIRVSPTARAATTSGMVTVTDGPMPGIIVVSMAGDGWTCGADGGNPCTRSDVLAPGAS